MYCASSISQDPLECSQCETTVWGRASKQWMLTLRVAHLTIQPLSVRLHVFLTPAWDQWTPLFCPSPFTCSDSGRSLFMGMCRGRQLGADFCINLHLSQTLATLTSLQVVTSSTKHHLGSGCIFYVPYYVLTSMSFRHTAKQKKRTNATWNLVRCLN